jgi:hypothetical protein
MHRLTSHDHDLLYCAQTYGYRFESGMDRVTKRIYDTHVRHGRMVRVKVVWSSLLTGTVEKTCYINLQTIFASEVV